MLRTDYRNDVIDVSVNERRKYRLFYNQDGTVSLEDATQYTQTGSVFGAGDINATNEKVNELDAGIGIDTRYNAETDNVEWSERGADTWHPFKKSGALKIQSDVTTGNKTKTFVNTVKGSVLTVDLRNGGSITCTVSKDGSQIERLTGNTINKEYTDLDEGTYTVTVSASGSWYTSAAHLISM